MFDREHEKAIALWRKEHPDAGYTPDMSDLNEWMVGRLEKAEAVKESLTSALKEIKKNVDDWNLQDYVTIRRLVNAALRTAEESSVVGLIDSTPAKQTEDSADADGDGDSVIDEEGGGMTKLEKALAHEGEPPCEYVKQMIVAAAMNHMTVNDRFIVGNFCPNHYGMPDTAHCDATTCEDCWNEEVEE